MTSAPAQPRRRLSKEARRAQLISSAEAVFSAVGYSGATMELIAAHDGVARSLLYEHFASIDALFVECHRAAREQMQQSVLEAALQAGPELRDQLRAGLVAYFEYFAQRPHRFDLLYGPGGPGGQLAMQTAELRFATAERIAALFIAAAPNIPPDEVAAGAHIISGGAEQLTRWWRRHPDVSIETLADRVMTAVWPGLQGRMDDN